MAPFRHNFFGFFWHFHIRWGKLIEKNFRLVRISKKCVFWDTLGGGRVRTWGGGSQMRAICVHRGGGGQKRAKNCVRTYSMPPKTTAFARGILTCQLVTQINLKYTTTFSLHVNAELMSNSMMLIKQAFHPFQSNPKYFYGPCPLVLSDRGIW